ncbi:unnamed protein product [Allacma fusca]|uniref:Protein kinase domain-containing protein n=1 Tax=Allacma fusca TaxID=39272 RepID=A0A8J2LTY4_9HEXA|nr:unnamed protein product [Allacma fusca]
MNKKPTPNPLGPSYYLVSVRNTPVRKRFGAKGNWIKSEFTFQLTIQGMATCPTRSKYIKQVGKYLLGLPLAKNSPKAITSWIAREDGTSNFRIVRIINLVEDVGITNEEIQKGKVFIQNELYLLQLLEGEPGIMKHYGMFRDNVDGQNNNCYSRICSVVDCYVPHDFSPAYRSLTNLYFYMKEVKRISEEEAIRLFIQCLAILVRVHEMHIVHRDLTMSNYVLDKRTGQIQLVNFGMGSLLTHEKELVPIQPGSPLYFSPEIIKGRPHLGKPADMWAMGVIFYGMLYSEFPFYACDLPSLYAKIGSGTYKIPINKPASPKSVRIIEGIFNLNPEERLTCQQVLDDLLTSPLLVTPSLQVVPSTDQTDSENYPGPKTIRRFPLSYDSKGEVRLKYAEVMRYQRLMFPSQNPPITAAS